MNIIPYTKIRWIILAGIVICSCGRQAQNLETPDALAGNFSITGHASAHIFQDHDKWLFQIGDGEPAQIDSAGQNLWHIPELGIELYGTKNSEGHRTIYLKRYGETVSLTEKPSHKLGETSTREMIDNLAPKLMLIYNVPGVSVAAIEEGKVAWLAQYGRKTYGRDEPVTENTVFEAASMSKPFYAYAVLQLVEERVIDLDTPLVEYVEEPYLEDEPLHKKITARMVLSHTSGFPNWRSGGWRGGGPVPVHFEPGSDFQYSGEGFLFLQQVVETLTGVPTEEFIQSRLLEPLGMHSSSYVWQPAYDSLAAAGHTREGEIPERKRRLYQTPNTAFTLYTTPFDYAQFLLEMMREDRSASHSLSTEILNEMLSIQSDAASRNVVERPGGNTKGTVHFGLGWRIEVLETESRFCHSGSNGTGFRCYSEFNPATGNGIVIMTNAASGAQVWADIMRYAGE